MTTNAGKIDRSLPIFKRTEFGTLVADLIDQFNALRADVTRLFLHNQMLLVAPTIVCTATSGHKVPKSSTAFAVWVGTAVVAKAADTDFSALSGTVAAGKYALWAHYIDSEGTISTSAKTADADTAAAALLLKPAVPSTKVELGYIIVHNGSESNWVGNTGALDGTDITTTYTANAAIADAGALAAQAVTALG